MRHLGRGDDRPLLGVAVVGVVREEQTTAEGAALNLREDGGFDPSEGITKCRPTALVPEDRVRGQVAERRNVAPLAEDRRGSGEQHAATAGIPGRSFRGGEQGIDEGVVQCVAPLGAVERPAMDAARDLDEQAVAHGRFRVSSRSNLAHSTTTRE